MEMGFILGERVNFLQGQSFLPASYSIRALIRLSHAYQSYKLTHRFSFNQVTLIIINSVYRKQVIQRFLHTMNAFLEDLLSCELHLHLAGSVYAEDFFDIGRDIFQLVDWEVQEFVTEYNRVFDTNLNPVELFTAVLHNPDHFTTLKKAYVFDETDSGDFERFMWKYRFFSRLWGYGWEQDMDTAVSIIDYILNHHQTQGLRYVEYRCGLFGTHEEKVARIIQLAEQIQKHDTPQFTPKLILPIPRVEPLLWEEWQVITAVLTTRPDLAHTIIGVDFASIEEGYPPKNLRPFVQALNKFNQTTPHLALDLVYHVGETYFDKSLESAIRWCHEAALLGAKRLGHCIALGLDPEIALARQPHAHEQELVSERLAQIAYDLTYQPQLHNYQITIDPATLQQEQTELQKLPPDVLVERPYSPQRLQEIRQRQQFVLDQLTKIGTVIECCPTSNLRIGAVPDAQHHPVHTFLASNVNLIISTDDPGIFDIDLRHELDWILQHSDYTPQSLAQRLGDPYRFRLDGGGRLQVAR